MGSFRRGVTSFFVVVLFLLLLIGLPIFLLVFVGWPFPQEMSSPEQLLELVQGKRLVSSDLIIGLLSIVMWGIWIQLLYVTFLEQFKVLKGNRGKYTVPGLQMLVAKVIAIATFVLSGFDAKSAHAVLPPSDVVQLDNLAVAPDQSKNVKKYSALASPFAQTITSVTVAEGENLWDIVQDASEENLSGLEVQETVNRVASINRIENADLVYPGQKLAVPSEIPKFEETQKNTQEVSFEVLESKKSVAKNVNFQKEEVTSHVVPLESSQETTTEASVKVNPSTPVDIKTLVVGLGVGGSILSAQVLNRLQAWRKFRVAHRPRGKIPTPSPASLHGIEKALHQKSESLFLTRLQKSIESLHARPVWEGEPVPQPTLFSIGKEGDISMSLERADLIGAPLPWETTDKGLHWVLPITADISQFPQQEHLPPIPLVVCFGETHFMNLEAAGILNISGEGETAQNLIRSLVHDLATSASAEYIDIRTTTVIEGTSTYSLVTHSPISEIVADIVPWVEELAEVFAEESFSNSYTQRLKMGEDPVSPVVLILDEESLVHAKPILDIAAKKMYPLSVIVQTEVPQSDLSGFSLHCDGNASAVLLPTALHVVPQMLTKQAAEAVGELLVNVRSEETEVLDFSTSVRDEDTFSGSINFDWPESADDFIETIQKPDLPNMQDEEKPDAEKVNQKSSVRCNVLGSVEIDGISSALTSQQLSLVTYLACKGSASRSSLINALWNGQAISKSRFPNLLTEVRSKIGRRNLPEAKKGIYRLADFSTDLDEFERAVEKSKNCSPSESIEILSKALELVRGAPFQDVGERYWTWTEDQSFFAAHIESVVAEVAATLATCYLESNQYEKAQWACEQGLLSSPLDETLVVLLTKTLLGVGKSSRAQRIVETWEKSISRLGCGDPSQEPRKLLKILH